VTGPAIGVIGARAAVDLARRVVGERQRQVVRAAGQVVAQRRQPRGRVIAGHLEEPMDFGAMRANAGAAGWKPPDGPPRVAVLR